MTPFFGQNLHKAASNWTRFGRFAAASAPRVIRAIRNIMRAWWSCGVVHIGPFNDEYTKCLHCEEQFRTQD